MKSTSFFKIQAILMALIMDISVLEENKELKKFGKPSF
jgi:hypothetical protein